MPNNIDDLRTHLFDTLKALKDKDAPMELDRARAVADVAKVLVDSAKVEVDFLKVTGATKGTAFLPDGDRPAPAIGTATRGPRAIPSTTTAAGDRCMLCEIRLTTPLSIERGLCGSCSDRPEAAQIAKPAAAGARR